MTFKTEEQKNRELEIAILIVNLLAEKNCTVEEGEEILACANRSLKASASVQKINLDEVMRELLKRARAGEGNE